MNKNNYSVWRAAGARDSKRPALQEKGRPDGWARSCRAFAPWLFTFLAAATTVAWAADTEQAAPKRKGFDPLSAEEQRLAHETALHAPNLSRLLAGAPRTELLLVERHEESKEVYANSGPWPRRADVFTYNYDQDVLIHETVDLATGKVDSVETAKSVQLPFTANESTAALRVALGDAEAGPLIRRQYRQIFGGEVFQPDKVEVNATVFYADSMPDGAVGPLAKCGVHRCAQLLLSAEGKVLNVFPTVDLSAGKVAHLGSFK